MYRIASLQIQPLLLTEDEGGNLGPLPPGAEVAAIVVSMAELVGSPLHAKLTNDLADLNTPVS